MDLCVTQTDCGYKLEAKWHGCIVDLKTDLGLQNALNNVPVEEQVRKAVDFIDGSSLCLGFELPDNE